MSDVLIELALDTGTKYFSVHGTSTGSNHYDGRILSMDGLKKAIRPGGGASAIETTSFELADPDGELRTLHDQATFKRRAVTVKLVDDSGAVTTQFVGKVETVSITPESISVEARDTTWDILTEKIPLRVFPDIFTDMPITTKVALIPIVIGTVSSASFDARGAIPAYLVDPSITGSKYRYVAAQHGLKSITKVYNRGVEVPVADWAAAYANITTDYGTVRMTFIDVDYDLRDENGEEDVTYDATGITVTPSDETAALETDIPDGLKLVLSSLQQTSPLVAGDFAATTTVDAQYTSQSISLSNNGLAITEWGTTWLDLIDLFAESFNLQVFVNSSGKFQMRFDDAQVGTATAVYVDGSDIVQGSFSVDSPEDSVATLECSYAYDWARGRPTARKDYTDSTEQTALGRNVTEEAELPCVRSINDAQKIAQIKLFQQRSSRDYVKLRIMAQSDLELGDFISLTHYAGPSTTNVGYSKTLFCVYELNLVSDGLGLFNDLFLIDHPGLSVGSPADSEETRTTQTFTARSSDIASDVVWTADDTNTISWTAHDLKIGDSLYETISSGNTGNMAARTYIYFDPDVSTSALQTSTTFSDSVGVRRVLVCEGGPGTTAAWIKNRVGWVETGVGGGGSTTPRQVTEDEIQVPNIGSVSSDLGSITAGTITGATIQTASGTGQRIVLTSTAFTTYNSSNQRQIEIPAAADRINFYHTTDLTGYLQGSDGVGGVVCFGNLAALDAGNGVRLIAGGDGTAGIDAYGGCTYLTCYGAFVPNSDGADLGSSTKHWDLFAQDIKVTSGVTPQSGYAGVAQLGTATYYWDNLYCVDVYTETLRERSGGTIALYDVIEPDTDEAHAIGTTTKAFGSVNAITGKFDNLDTIDSSFTNFNQGIRPASDNAYTCGSVAGGNYRWSDVRSVLINGSDIGFANGWKFREFGLADKDVGKPDDWIKDRYPDGLQLMDQKGEVKFVFHQDGNLYVAGDVLPLSKLGRLKK